MEDVRKAYISSKAMDPSTILIPKQIPKSKDIGIATTTAINIQNHVIRVVSITLKIKDQNNNFNKINGSKVQLNLYFLKNIEEIFFYYFN